MAAGLIRGFAEAVDKALSHPSAVPVYAAASLGLWLAVDENTNTLLLSHFANICLVSLAVAQRRSNCLMQEEIRALVAVHPDIDEREVERSAEP